MDGHIPLSGAGVWNGEIIAPAQFYMYDLSTPSRFSLAVTVLDGVLLIHG
jgi:hypothetical protein